MTRDDQKDSTPILHCFGESGNAYKVALTAELLGQPWTPRFVDFFNGEARSPEYRKINVMAEVPVWIEGDLTLSQSAVIQLHLAERHGKLLGQTPRDRSEVLRWLFWDNHKLSAQLGQLRFLSNFIPEAKRPTEVIAFLMGRTKVAYDTLNRQLEGRDWVAADTLTIADLACAGYLFYPEPFGFDRSAWPHIDAWLSRLSDLDGWKHPYDLMPGRPSDRATL